MVMNIKKSVDMWLLMNTIFYSPVDLEGLRAGRKTKMSYSALGHKPLPCGGGQLDS